MLEAITPILQLLAFSALATDCAQTAHWIEGTAEEPILSPAGWPTYELNPILAGHPEKREAYFAWWRRVAEAAPRMLSPPVATALLAWIAIEDGQTVLRNNRFSQEAGFPVYWMVAWQWHF